MKQATIEFFWDCVSPYSYLAATQIGQLATDVGAELRWRPLLLGGVFKATGNQPPASLPAKGRYLFRDVARWGLHYGVPVTFPQPFPANSLLAQRLACAAPDHAGLALTLMRAYWGEGRDISDQAVLRDCVQSVGLDADALLAAAQTEAVKALLKANTEEAVARGAFGAPSFFVGEELFWGNDRLPLLREHLRGGRAA